MELFYTSGDNARLAQMTIDAGWQVGMRSDKTPCTSIDFLDIKYNAPKFGRHLTMAAEHKPVLAVVPDLSSKSVCKEDIARALQQAESLSDYCQYVLIVPKLSGQLPLIPAEFRIGYSIPTSNGGAKYGVWKLEGRPVHLLGGSPQNQMLLARYCTVASVDGNMVQKMAFSFCKYWATRGPYWFEHPLKHTGEPDLPYRCIEMSLRNIKEAWIKHAR